MISSSINILRVNVSPNMYNKSDVKLNRVYYIFRLRRIYLL